MAVFPGQETEIKISLKIYSERRKDPKGSALRLLACARSPSKLFGENPEWFLMGKMKMKQKLSFRWFRIMSGPPKLRILQKQFGGNAFTMLDVGAGNHSATTTKEFFPSCRYYGLDLSRDYNNDEADFRLMERFYEIDLTTLDYTIVPDNYFDVISVSHVIEHLPNALEVLPVLAQKLKAGGIIYVEWPHPRSVGLPSMRDSLNFYDDPTHVRLYGLAEVCNALHAAGVTPRHGGTRRNWWYLFFSPLLIPWRAWHRGYLAGPDVWDWTGFAQYVVAERRNCKH